MTCDILTLLFEEYTSKIQFHTLEESDKSAINS